MMATHESFGLHRYFMVAWLHPGKLCHKQMMYILKLMDNTTANICFSAEPVLSFSLYFYVCQQHISRVLF